MKIIRDILEKAHLFDQRRIPKMAIYQTNTWVCEVCGKIESSTKEVFPYDDPVVEPNDKVWEYTREFPNEKLACPECLKSIGNKNRLYKEIV